MAQMGLTQIMVRSSAAWAPVVMQALIGLDVLEGLVAIQLGHRDLEQDMRSMLPLASLPVSGPRSRRPRSLAILGHAARQHVAIQSRWSTMCKWEGMAS